MNPSIIDERKNQSRAESLSPAQRRQLALPVLTRSANISELARQNDVSRKFIYQNARLADEAIHSAYQKPLPSDDEVLFYLPVTIKWIRQLVVALVFLCHASFRGIQSLFSEVFDYSISIGSIHNYVAQLVPKARQINQQVPLDKIRVGAHDELFQARRPVLTGVDAESTYCYLLALVDHRDETTWGVHLLDLQDRGLNLDKVIADFGRGLRAGHKEAWPDTPLWGDIFHPLMELHQLVRFLKGRLTEAQDHLLNLQIKLDDKKKQVDGRTLSRKLGLARTTERKARHTYEVVEILTGWVQHELFGLHGPSHQERDELYDFVVDAFKEVEPNCEYRIRPVRRLLENNKKELLYFAQELENKLGVVAQKWGVELEVVYGFSQTLSWGEQRSWRWYRQARHYEELGEQYEAIMDDVENALSSVIRASSLVENFNSRLRNYFFLRRQLSDDYLCLLQFFLNHQRYVRSHREERRGKSPRELLTGENHAHWLDLLGFERFKRA